MSFLVEIDKLIALLESPIFTYLRMQLLEPQQYSHLIRALFGILMLLPQSTAYATLRSRLDCVPTIFNSLQGAPGGGAPAKQKGNVGIKVDFAGLLQHFDAVRAKHVEADREQLRQRTDILAQAE